MAEEELNIDGYDFAPEQAAKSGTQCETHGPKIEQHVGDVHTSIQPGLSDEKFLDALLTTPSDQLIPWEQVELPSAGLYYSWPDGTIEVRAMGQVAEQALATQRLAQSGQSIDMLFRTCCRFPSGFDPVDLLLGDRTFLLYYIRGITHGNMYEFAVTCPNPDCGAVTMHAYDLNELAGTIKYANRALGTEPFKIILPYLTKASGRDVFVGVRFMRGTDATNIAARRKVKNKVMVRPGSARTRQAVMPQQQRQTTATIDSDISEQLERVIVHVLGDSNQFKIRQFVEKLHSEDTATIRQWLRDNTPGVDNTIEVSCPDCSNTFVVELPITEGFFRPAERRGIRA